jgi:branched-subunit amino acid aminotransferase/4-amino-4-deoxychorismate lyase
MLEKHLARLFASARALDFKNVHSKVQTESLYFLVICLSFLRILHASFAVLILLIATFRFAQAEIERAIFATLAANGMRDSCHIRLTMSRGVKTTSSMNPNFNVFGYVY